MARPIFNQLVKLLRKEDYDKVVSLLGGDFREPDEIILSGGKPYIYRWYIIPFEEKGPKSYLHIQVLDDTERAMHDHPWANQSVILAGGYEEEFWKFPPATSTKGVRKVKKGDVVHRGEEEAHRLKLLPGEPYTISLFTTGPVVRQWGFWEEFPIPKWTSANKYKDAHPAR
jgi:hypothetical protein